MKDVKSWKGVSSFIDNINLISIFTCKVGYFCMYMKETHALWIFININIFCCWSDCCISYYSIIFTAFCTFDIMLLLEYILPGSLKLNYSSALCPGSRKDYWLMFSDWPMMLILLVFYAMKQRTCFCLILHLWIMIFKLGYHNKGKHRIWCRQHAVKCQSIINQKLQLKNCFCEVFLWPHCLGSQRTI